MRRQPWYLPSALGLRKGGRLYRHEHWGMMEGDGAGCGRGVLEEGGAFSSSLGMRGGSASDGGV